MPFIARCCFPPLAVLLLCGAVKPVYQSEVVTPATPGAAVEIKTDLNDAKSLFLVVTDGGDGFACDWADWIEPKLSGPAGELKLTEVKWKSATSGWGQPRVGANTEGGPLMVAGKPVSGIGTHAVSVIEYAVPAGYTTFTARGGIDDGGAKQSNGQVSSVRFAVYTQRPEIAATVPAGGGSRLLEDALAGLDTPEDLQITLFAGEPDLLNPTSIDIDARGRVWVCEVVNYRHFANADKPLREAGDRILILEDTDGDAVADKTTVFYQGRDIDSAHGITVLGDKVIVSAGENVFLFTDANGDDKPEKKELLFTGISGTQHDHGIHAFAFGPDGRLYFNFGNAGERLKDKNGKPVVDRAGNVVEANGKPYRQGMVFRCDLDGSNVETLAWNFRNNWEVAVDSFGTMWQSDNDDDGNKAVRINYVMEYGNYGYTDERTGAGWREPRTNLEADIPHQHWHTNDPGVVPNVLLTGAGAPTGIIVYEGNLLPERFRGQMIHCDAGPNVVRAYPVNNDGAGYSATIEDVAVGNRDQWFRPSDVCVAPDGSLLIADWYDPGVGGHRMGDIERGRIFRVTSKGQAAKYSVPKVDVSTPEGAVAALKSPNLATRYLGWTALAGMGAKAEPALSQLWKNYDPRLRARALWLLGRIDDGDAHIAHIVAKAAQDQDANIRIVAVRLARQRAAQGRPFPLETMRELAHDPEPQVRRELAIAMREVETSKAVIFMLTLASYHDGKDRWYLEALGIAADGRWNEMLPYLDAIRDSRGPNQAERDIIWRSRADATSGLLAEIVRDPEVPLDELPRYFRAFDFQPEAARTPVLMELAFAPVADGDARAAYIAAESLARIGKVDLANNAAQRTALNAVLDRAQGTRQFVEFVERFNIADRDDELIALAIAHPADELGVLAAGSLLKRDRKPVIQQALEGDRSQAALLAEALGNTANGRSVGVLLPVVNNGKADAEVRRKAVAGLAKSKPGAERLLALTKDKSLDAALLPAAAAALHGATFPELQADINQVFPLPPGKANAPLPPISVLAQRRGNVGDGKLVYMDAGTCAKCHQVNGLGQNVGPDLSEIGSKLSREAMFESILYPSAGISHSYESYVAVTADGNVVTGLMTSETSTEVSLKAIDGIVRTFKKADLDDLVKQNVSLMPADLQKVLTEQQLVDVVEFLTTLRKK